MCSPARCRACGKTTWSGCGNHVEQVKARVPDDQWCTCAEDGTSAKDDAGPSTSFLGRLLGR